MALLEGSTKLNWNNVLNRLSYGLIGLDLKAKNDQEAAEYLDSCISLCKELDIGEETPQLLQIFDYEVPSTIKDVVKRCRDLDPLLEDIQNNTRIEDIPKAKQEIKSILATLYELVRVRDTLG